MSLNFQAVKGMNDCLPDEINSWQTIEALLKNLVSGAGYQEIRFPLLESTGLFKRTIGDNTDVVEKEMYSFEDYGENLSLRPEGTAGCVRACLEHGLLRQIQKLWYYGPMFRHEKPQKGRYRQFHQFGMEIFGVSEHTAELELMLMMQSLLKQLNLQQYVSLQINCLGTAEERAQYRNTLTNYLSKYENDLDSDSKRRLYTNPLRILDSKNEHTQIIIQDAPQLINALGAESIARFENLKEGLNKLGISFFTNNKLVRGLDYYSHTVFEYVTDHLGSQGTICAGGRYDKLVELLGGTATPAVGMAIGFERLLLLYKAVLPDVTYIEPSKIFYVMPYNENYAVEALQLMQQLRTNYKNFVFMNYLASTSLKSQFKKADKLNANYAIILGEQEVANNMITLKNLQSSEPQQMFSKADFFKLLDLLNRGR